MKAWAASGARLAGDSVGAWRPNRLCALPTRRERRGPPRGRPHLQLYALPAPLQQPAGTALYCSGLDRDRHQDYSIRSYTIAYTADQL